MPEPILRTTGLSKHFGGLAAVSGVALALYENQVHAVIGPNGAGKSTLINLLSGDLAPSSGSIRFEDQEIGGLRPESVAARGIGRSYQKTNIFPGFTLFENCRLAAQARAHRAMRFFRPAHSYHAINQAAEAALTSVGLAQRARDIAATLSHGEQRQLEIAMTLATEPKLLLLDEPLAGMGAEESAGMTALITRLARDHAILLVEHDMDAVFSVAAILTVMVDGKVLASGTPQAIRADRAVQDAYLGEAAS